MRPEADDRLSVEGLEKIIFTSLVQIDEVRRLAHNAIERARR